MNHKAYIKCYPCDFSDPSKCGPELHEDEEYLKCHQVGPTNNFSDKDASITGNGCGNQLLYTDPRYIQKSNFDIRNINSRVIFIIILFIVLLLKLLSNRFF